MFRVGESYWMLAPEDVDREQEFALQAIEEWDKVIDEHPDTEESKQAQAFIKQGQRRIAESFDFISKFYCKLEVWHSCAFRSVRLARLYPQFTKLRALSLKRASEALENVAKEARLEIKRREDEGDETPMDTNIYTKTLSPDQIISLSQKLAKEAAG